MNKMEKTHYNQRIDAADVLRGFAIMGILLVHCVEHYNYFSYPKVDSMWMKFLDKSAWDSVFFLFAGKTYSIFALLFGFTFFIQNENQLKQGYDFRLRFMWRMLLLFIFGCINGFFYPGDILVTYALLSFTLVLVSRLKTKIILIIAAILMLQPVELAKIVYALINPDHIPGPSLEGQYWSSISDAMANRTFWEAGKINLWHGQLFTIAWCWENARILQTTSLFMIGFVIGRLNLFVKSENSIRFWSRALVIGILCFFPLDALANMLPDFIANKAISSSLSLICRSLSNMVFMTFTMSLIIVFYHTTKRGFSVLDKLKPYGKMTLTNYLTQSVVGTFLFFNWGLKLQIGVAYSVLLGIVLFLLQYSFSSWWMKHHSHGPLEYIWKKLTWIGKKKMNIKMEKHDTN